MTSLFALVFLLFSEPGFSEPTKGAMDKFELVVTLPSETKLDPLGLREPVTVWSEMIDQAVRKIDLEHMYASGKPGEPLDKIIERLEAAGNRGVKIRLLLEEGMLRASIPETLERLKKIPGLELRMLKFADIAGEGIIHSKFSIVDNTVAYLGSQNFDWRALKHIHETGVRVSDAKIATQMQAIFDMDWAAAGRLSKKQKVKLTGKPSPAPINAKAYLVASPPNFLPKGVAASEVELPNLLSKAKDEIRIQLLDYYPLNRDKTYYGVIDNALRAAQARKVKIKLLVSHWNLGKPGVDHLKSLSVLPGVEVRVATVPAAAEGFIPFGRVIHSKIMTIDQTVAWVGTSNWTGGYLNTSRNLELVMNDSAQATKLNAVFDQVWNAPFTAKIDVNKDYEKPNKGGE